MSNYNQDQNNDTRLQHQRGDTQKPQNQQNQQSDQQRQQNDQQDQ
jgi:hypothetical protein